MRAQKGDSNTKKRLELRRKKEKHCKIFEETKVN